MLEGSRGHVKPTFSDKSDKVLPPNEVIKVERGPKKGRKRMKEWGEVTFMKEWVKALSERSILAPADLRYLFSFPRYRNLKMHSWSIQIYNSNILPLLNAWFEACFSGPNKPLLTQCTVDPLVWKWPEFQGLFRLLRGSNGLSARRARRTKSTSRTPGP